jgi:ABC-type phosphate transport system substrate-binding protein
MTAIITAAIVCVTLIYLSFVKINFTINVNLTQGGSNAGVELSKTPVDIKTIQKSIEKDTTELEKQSMLFNEAIANINKVMNDGGKD